jgi:hypothetical protein
MKVVAIHHTVDIIGPRKESGCEIGEKGCGCLSACRLMRTGRNGNGAEMSGLMSIH